MYQPQETMEKLTKESTTAPATSTDKHSPKEERQGPPVPVSALCPTELESHSLDPVPALLARGAPSRPTARPCNARNLPPGAYFTDARSRVLTPSGKTPLNVLGAELRLANKPDLVLQNHQRSVPTPGCSPLEEEALDNTSEAEPSNTSGGLMVASLVDESEENALDLQKAEEYDPEAAKRISTSTLGSKDGPSTKPWKACVAALAIVSVITLILVFTLNEGPQDGSLQAQVQQPFEEPLEDLIIPDSLSLEEHVLCQLPEFTKRQISQDPDSPQALAYNWMLQDPFISDYDDARIQQRYALATLYFSTGGSSWTRNDNWLNHSTHECIWYQRPAFALKDIMAHVYKGYLDEFHPPTEAPPTACNDRGQYENLWLDQNNLVGSFPKEFYMLTHLKTLSSGMNRLHGSIATQIVQLSNLEGYALSVQVNAGEIPSEIGLLSNLRGLILNDNNHIGSIPSELWQLTNLQTIIMARNHELKGSISSEIGTFSKLRFLMLEDSDLTGTIPSEIGLLDHLMVFGAGGNRLTAEIPSEIGTLNSLSIMSLYKNQLKGRLPSELGLLSAATLLSFRENELTGTVPTEFGLLTSLAMALNFQENQFSGPIPSEFSNFQSLFELSLMDNSFTGTIPSELGLLTSMGRLSLGSNSLSGTLPTELSNLQSSLYTLNIEGNELLSGAISEGLCNLQGTCIPDPLVPCIGDGGLLFDCSSNLCGCGCSACDATRNETRDEGNLTTLVIIPEH